jgi:prepilin-type N-terminal cleavage/methylation domain-containing protein
MPRNAAGFTLLEVLVALVVVTVGLLGLLGTLGPIAKLAGQGRMYGRAAQVLASPADLLRALVQAGAPGCFAPGSGSQRHADGVLESWSAQLRSSSVHIEIVAGADTMITRIPCP